MDVLNLLKKSFTGDIEDNRVNDIFGGAFYDSRMKDLSNLIDFSTGANQMGNNPSFRNAIDEKFKGALKVDANKIGVMGYSIGGGAVFEILGAGDVCNGNIYYDSRIGPAVSIGPNIALNHKENFPGINNNMLIIIGDGDYKTSYEALVRELRLEKEVIFAGAKFGKEKDGINVIPCPKRIAFCTLWAIDLDDHFLI